MSPQAVAWTVNCSILYTDRPLLERPAAAAADGFTAVEFWWPFAEAVPGDREVDAFVRAIEDAGVRLTGLNFFAGDMPAGDRGLVSWPARTRELLDNIPVVAAIGERLGCRSFNALYGNRIDGAGDQDETAVANLAACVRGVAAIGGTVLLEPVSGAPRYPLLRAADAVAAIDRVTAVLPDSETDGDTDGYTDGDTGSTMGIGLLADFYHLAVNGDDVAIVIDKYADRIAHVQIADAPGRGAPGTGTLPLDRWIDRLHAAGYQGRVGLEYQHDGPGAFDWLAREHRAG
ncbi:hydroxypyruvate isomerase family protein [Nonomuraea aridisoli]|uniref:Hydroxypyruvate isomerase n=1 Tax=Nonomuraea aridisoli TaxID=2070368 RepID=A0A2W2F8Y8_9ACTN|nr:TIM barrel protein [Nonomuraea aridisoli]PZG22010.1 hydroxypyruvate isomerase [Nonomuraea aridisoli]